MKQHDFDGALEYMDGKHYHPNDMMNAFGDEIRFALRLAKRLMESPSEDMFMVGFDKADEHFQVIYEAMRDQLVKEVSDV